MKVLDFILEFSSNQVIMIEDLKGNPIIKDTIKNVLKKYIFDEEEIIEGVRIIDNILIITVA